MATVSAHADEAGNETAPGDLDQATQDAQLPPAPGGDPPESGSTCGVAQAGESAGGTGLLDRGVAPANPAVSPQDDARVTPSSSVASQASAPLVLAAFAAGTALGVAIWLVARRRPQAPGAAARTEAAAPTMEDLVRRLQERPMDGEANFELALQLLARGDARGINHLAVSFKAFPAGVLRLLQDPTLAPLRSRSDVNDLLRHHHRELQQRGFTGYA